MLAFICTKSSSNYSADKINAKAFFFVKFYSPIKNLIIITEYSIGWSEKTFLFPITFPGVRKVGIWSKNMLESDFAWLHAKMAVLPPSSGSSDPNFA